MCHSSPHMFSWSIFSSLYSRGVFCCCKSTYLQTTRERREKYTDRSAAHRHTQCKSNRCVVVNVNYRTYFPRLTRRLQQTRCCAPFVVFTATTIHQHIHHGGYDGQSTCRHRQRKCLCSGVFFFRSSRPLKFGNLMTSFGRMGTSSASSIFV